MTRRAAVRTAATAALAALLLVVSAAPASAVPQVWQGTGCASGAITEYASRVTAGGVREVSVAGWVQPCGEPSDTATFALMRYHPDAAVREEPRSFDSWDAPTAFALTVAMDPLPGAVIRPDEQYGGPLAAICLVRGYWSPLSCVGIGMSDGEWPETGVAPTVRPLPLDATVIRSVPVAYGGPVPVVNPTCGNCV